MANKWWVNADADNNFNNDNNWSTSEGGAGGAGVPGASDNAYFSNTSSSAACNLSANISVIVLAQHNNVTGGTDRYTGAFDAVTFDVTTSGQVYWNQGNIDYGTGTWTCADNWFTDNALPIYGTSTVTLTGTSKTLTYANNGSFASLEVSGSYTLVVGTSGITITDALTVSGTGTFDIAARPVKFSSASYNSIWGNTDLSP